MVRLLIKGRSASRACSEKRDRHAATAALLGKHFRIDGSTNRGIPLISAR